VKFVGSIARQGDRRSIAIPKEKLSEIKELEGKQLKITIEELEL